MAGLLVSVRSAAEAAVALAGGATVVDVKEPDRGALGRAGVSVWREVCAVVPECVPLSVALGELRDWAAVADPATVVPAHAFAGITYRKLGLAGAGSSWAEDWARLRRAWPGDSQWVAVAYADGEDVDAPCARGVLEVAVTIPECAGLLIDTYDKSRRLPLDGPWRQLIERAHACDRFVALAGGLSGAAIARLAPLGPDLFAVRGAACRDGDRHAAVDVERVAGLARLVASIAPSHVVAGRGTC